MWLYTGNDRPPFAQIPGPEQESVWDYPRPPALVQCNSRVDVAVGPSLLATTRRAFRLLETASPPTFYLPPDSVDRDRLVQAPTSSFCEWKGAATYWSLAQDPDALVIGWSYEVPTPPFTAITGYLSFFPRLLLCHVDGERVRPQPGYFYGGWITRNIVGPFKGGPGSGHW